MPSYPHVIRLRGPWDYEPLEYATPGDGPSELPPAGRTTLPGDWGDALGRDFRGRVRYRRRFNRPSGLDPHERIWLVVAGADARASVTLNGHQLGEVPGYALHGEFDVTESIEPRNELFLEVELAGGGHSSLRSGREHKPGGPLGEVRLEVRSTVFVSQLAVWIEAAHGTGRLHVAGRINGETAGSAMAVVVGGRERELLYGDVQAGESFELTDVIDDLPCWGPTSASQATLPLEIKLVAGGAAAWQAVRRTGCSRVRWEPLAKSLAVWDVPIDLPAQVLDPPEREMDERRFREWLATLGLPSNVAAGLREIMPDAWYDHFDALGRSLVQWVPRDWAAEVCPRLVHHPSIVAWASPSGAVAPPAKDPSDRSSFGRPWISGDTGRP